MAHVWDGGGAPERRYSRTGPELVCAEHDRNEASLGGSHGVLGSVK